MRFLGDIPIGRATIEHLTAHGHDAVHVSALLPSTATDLEIVDAAIREGRTILCFDLDFSAIVAASGLRAPSVVTFRTRIRNSRYINRRLDAVLEVIEPELTRGAMVTVDDGSVRIRTIPIRGSVNGGSDTGD